MTIDEQKQLQEIMAFKRGRAFVYRLLETCGIYRSSFASEALAMAFREGERNVGLRLLSEVTEVSPEKYHTMLKEAREREVIDEQRDANDRDELTGHWLNT